MSIEPVSNYFISSQINAQNNTLDRTYINGRCKVRQTEGTYLSKQRMFLALLTPELF